MVAALTGAGAIRPWCPPPLKNHQRRRRYHPPRPGDGGGVRYQQSSGGPAGYWAGVWSYPQRKWIFTSGYATTTWTFWYIKLADRGKYATVYRLRNEGRDYRTEVLHRCPDLMSAGASVALSVNVPLDDDIVRRLEEHGLP